MIPDCGVFSTPRREPSLRAMEKVLNQSPQQPKSSSSTYSLPTWHSSPGATSSVTSVTLSSGYSFGFYKSPNRTVTPLAPLTSPPATKGGVRRPRDTLNRGVGHKIKKPKLKAKTKLKAREDVKTVTKRLKERKYVPPPHLPSNRSPLKPHPTPQVGDKKKKRTLSSPGISLLGCEESPEFIPDPKSGKFFTSRSRAAATVQIGKNIQLSAKYGDVSLKQTEARFAKKNVGRQVEEELHRFLDRPTKPLQATKLLLPSVQANPRPTPTRVPSSPSPRKKTASTPQHKKLPAPTSPKKKGGGFPSHPKPDLNESCGELQDLEPLLAQMEHNHNNKMEQQQEDIRRSPRKHKGSDMPEDLQSLRRAERNPSPARKSPRKMQETQTPTRKSVQENQTSTRKSLQENQTSTRKSLQENQTPILKSLQDNQTPTRKSLQENQTPTRKSPRKLVNSFDTQGIEGQSPKRKWGDRLSSPRASPRRTPRTSPKKQEEAEGNSSSSSVSPRNTVAKELKLFPIFDPKKRLSDVKKSDSTTAARPASKWSMKNKDESQMIIDAGQKKFGFEQCKVCGVVYEVDNPMDESTHSTYHNRYLAALKFKGWKNENVVRDLPHLGSRVIMVSSKDPAHYWRKVEEVLEMVDEELGFLKNSNITRENTRVFLYVLEQSIVGCLVAESINQAYRVVPQESEASNKDTNKPRMLCCSNTPVKVWAGVSRLWVQGSHRGKHVASTMVDAMRGSMIFSHFLTMDEFAFSSPTESGLAFAEKYTDKRDFLVYRQHSV